MERRFDYQKFKHLIEKCRNHHYLTEKGIDHAITRNAPRYLRTRQRRSRELVNAYLHSFVGDEGKCPNCDSTLRNTMGSFYWGLVHGEAHCSGSMSNERCGWPCRAIHDIKDADGQSLFNRPLFLILPYHPEYVRNEAISPVS